jgi:hypothetical protein
MNDSIVANTSVVDIADVSLTFPTLPDWTVDRENNLQTIEQIFERDHELILLDGSEGSGKTFALALFCRRHATAAFSIFVKPASDLAYDAAYCRMDLCNQIQWHLTGKTLDDSHYPSPAAYRSLVHRLSNDARRRRRQYYFVIDGIADIPNAASGARQALIEQLPLGLPGIQFLMTGNLKRIPELSEKRLKLREQDISPFSLEETQRLFAGLNVDSQSVIDLHKRFSKTPGKLASARRIYDQTSSGDAAIGRIEDPDRDILTIEWGLSEITNQNIRRAVAALAFIPNVADLSTLAKISEIPPGQIGSDLAQLPYLVVDSNRERVSFASEALRAIAKKNLINLESDVLERCVRTFNSRPVDLFTAQVLPELLERQGNPSALFHFLSRDNMAALFLATNSLGSLQRQIQSAASVAESTSDESRALQYAFDRSTLKELLSSGFSNAQIRATQRILGSAEAVRLANSEVAVEDRLHALSEVAKLQKTDGTLDPAVLADVINLCAQVEAVELGERAVEIASAIMYFDPSLALDLLKRSANADDSANAMDAALTAISIRAYLTDPGSGAAVKTMLSANEIDKGERYRGLLGLFASEQSAEALIAEASVIKRTSDRLSFLQQWIRENHRDPGALAVGRKIITTVLDDSSYAPNARVLRDATLPLAVDHAVPADVSDIVAVVRSQGTVLKNAGPIVDYYRARFHLDRALVITGGSQSLASFEEDVLELEDEEDLTVRVSCLAWLHATILSIGLGDNCEDALGVANYARTELGKAVLLLLAQTAEHIEVMRPVIRAIAGLDDELLSTLIASVNTADRRDQCINLTARFGRVNPYLRPSLKQIRGVISRHSSSDRNAGSVESMRVDYIRWFSSNYSSLDVQENNLGFELDVASLIADPVDRIVALGELVSSSAFKDQMQIENALERIQKGVDDAETPARQREACFLASSALALAKPVIAKELFERAKGRRLCADYEESVLTLGTEIVRSFSGLARMRAASDVDMAKVREVFGSLESPILRCRVATLLSLSVYSVQKDLAKEISQTYIKPVIQSFLQKDQLKQPLVAEVITSVAPALWIVHSAQAMQTIGRLDREKRDEAYENILLFIMYGSIDGEPFDRPQDQPPDLTDESAADVLSVLSQVTTDNLFCRCASAFLRALRERAPRRRFSKLQVAEWCRQLAKLAKEKLPEPGGIAHNGYLILVEAELHAVEKSSDASWNVFIERGKAVPNAADAAFVCARLVEIIPSRNTTARVAAFDASAEAIAGLPLVEDRVDRSETLFEEGWNVRSDRCKSLAREVFESSLTVSRDPVRRRRLRLVESVHRFDEDLAASLASLAEKQSSLMLGKTEVTERLSRVRLTNELGTNKCSEEIAKKELSQISSACFGALARLNGGGAITVTINELRTLLIRAGEGSFQESSPIHAFACEAIVKRYQNVKDVGPECIRDLFNKYTDSYALLIKLLQSLREPKDEPILSETKIEGTGVFIVPPGGREHALRWISAWLVRMRPEELTIVDPYFGPGDLQAVDLVQRELPTCRVTVITTGKVQHTRAHESAKHCYDANWKRISLGEPPETKIIIVSAEGDVPVLLHDRWWASKNGGFGTGTSFNSLGDKLAELHELDREACSSLLKELAPFVELVRRTSGGQRLSYQAFTLL